MRVLFSVLLFSWTALAQDQCLIRYEYLNYPPIARVAKAQGAVRASFEVDEIGAVKGAILLDGPQMFFRIVQDVIEQSKFPTGCAGEHTVEVEFRIRDKLSYDPELLAEVYEPSHYRLTMNTLLANIDYAPSRAAHPWLGWLGRLLRR